MPIPNPKSGQSQEDYMGVCMTFMDNEKSKYPEHKQRVAICLETYRRNESDDLLKRLDLMINDTTATGDVAMPQGQVMGMQYRKKKKKAKGGASYEVHESKDDVVAKIKFKGSTYELKKDFRWGGMLTHIVYIDGKEITQEAPNLKPEIAISNFKKNVKDGSYIT
jgi:hypothetical protein